MVRRQPWLVLSLVFVLACLATSVLAEVEVRSSLERRVYGVTLFDQTDFEGVGYFFRRDVADLAYHRFNNRAASVRVDPGCEVRLFEGSRFSGRSVQFRGDVSTLRSIGNDRVSSLRVRCHSDSWDDGYWDDGDWGGDGRRGVTLYRDLRLTGTSETFLDDDPDLRDNRVGNDQVTSVRVSRGCRAILYEHPGFRGRYTELSSDAFDLRGSTVGDDRISSLRVRCDGRPGGGYGGDPGWDRDRGVTLHRDLGFTGTSETFYGDVPSLSGSRIGNDQATSVSVPRGCFVRLYEHHNYQGDYTELNRDDPDLRGSRVGDDSVSSLRIECRRW